MAMLLVEQLQCLILWLIDVRYFLTERLFEYHCDGGVLKKLLFIRDQLSNESCIRPNLRSMEANVVNWD